MADTDIDEATSKNKLEKINFNYVINGLQIRPHFKSRLSIPISRLEPLPLVRPKSWIWCSIVGEGDRVLYISIVKDRGGEFMCNRGQIEVLGSNMTTNEWCFWAVTFPRWGLKVKNILAMGGWPPNYNIETAHTQSSC